MINFNNPKCLFVPIRRTLHKKTGGRLLQMKQQSKGDFMYFFRYALCHKITVPDPNLVENDGFGSTLNARGFANPVKSNERGEG
jgi:hypothetical protein